MPEFEVPVEFSVYCSCGEGLCNQSEAKSQNGGHSITVEPCTKCMEVKFDEGHDTGYAKAVADEMDRT